MTIPPGPGPRKFGPKLLLKIWAEPKEPWGGKEGEKTWACSPDLTMSLSVRALCPQIPTDLGSWIPSTGGQAAEDAPL